MSNVTVIHLTVDCHVWTVCHGVDNTDTSTQLRCVILLLLIFLGTKVDGRVESCSSRCAGFGKLFTYDKPGKLL